MSPRVLLIDASPDAFALKQLLTHAGVEVDVSSDTVDAIACLNRRAHDAVVLDPMIRQRLNGFAVVCFLEAEQPERLARVFLWTALSPQTIERTAPGLAARLYRKHAGTRRLCETLTTLVGVREAAAPRRVLIVEDDAATAEALAQTLEHLGYASEWMACGAKVVDAVTTRDYEVVLLDVVLPDIDGFAILEALAAARPEMLPHVVITTGLPRKVLEEQLDRRRVGGVLEKPVTASALRRLLFAPGSQIAEGGGETPVLR